MPDDDLSAADLAEILRKKQKYREWILSGRITLPHDRAAQLLGPDCMYHLYGQREQQRRRRNRLKNSRSGRRSDADETALPHSGPDPGTEAQGLADPGWDEIAAHCATRPGFDPDSVRT
jgi:hypothetical protein